MPCPNLPVSNISINAESCPQGPTQGPPETVLPSPGWPVVGAHGGGGGVPRSSHQLPCGRTGELGGGGVGRVLTQS